MAIPLPLELSAIPMAIWLSSRLPLWLSPCLSPTPPPLWSSRLSLQGYPYGYPYGYAYGACGLIGYPYAYPYGYPYTYPCGYPHGYPTV